MARKKQQAETLPLDSEATAPAPPVQPLAGERPSMAEAIRQSLAALGLDKETTHYLDWVIGRWPGLVASEASFNTALSQQRKKARGEGGAGAKTTTPLGWRTSGPLPGSPPSVDDLMRVKKIADEQGGVFDLLGMVKTVQGLADEVGGIDRLRRCLEVLFDLTGDK